MMSVKLIAMVLGFVCLLLAALGVSTTRINLGWLGLALWLLGVLLA